MSDEERQEKRRKARLGDEDAATAVNRQDARLGEGIVGFLLELVGKCIWIEGIRINYRGTLRQVIRNADGTPGALVLFPFQRVSYFIQRGPDTNYTFDHAKPHMVPYEIIHDVGEDGFLGSSWPKPRES